MNNKRKKKESFQTFINNFKKLRNYIKKTFKFVRQKAMPLSHKIIQDAITFDDVLLVPSYSEILPNQVSLKTRLTDKIMLNIPLVSVFMSRSLM